MKFDIYYHTTNNGFDGTPWGAGIVLNAIDHNRIRRREFGFYFPIMTEKQAELRTVTLALAGIGRQFRGLPVTIHSSSQYLIDMLSKSGNTYNISPEEHVEDIIELRRWCVLYTTQLSADSPRVFQTQAHNRALLVLKSKTNYDSGTTAH